MYYARKIDTYAIVKKIAIRHLVTSLQVCEKAEPPAVCQKIEQVFVKMSYKSVNLNSLFVANPMCCAQVRVLSICKSNKVPVNFSIDKCCAIYKCLRAYSHILYCVHFSLNTSVTNFVFNLVQKEETDGVT